MCFVLLDLCFHYLHMAYENIWPRRCDRLHGSSYSLLQYMTKFIFLISIMNMWNQKFWTLREGYKSHELKIEENTEN